MTARHTLILPAACLLAAFLLPVSCTKQEPSGAGDPDEIRISAGFPEAADPTTKTTFQTQDLLNTNGIKVDAYNQGTTDLFFSDKAEYNDGGWEFSGKHYWSEAKDATHNGRLDFFAYYPADPSSACVSIGTYAASSPVFSCTALPLTNGGQSDAFEEFVFAFEADKGNLTGSSTGNTVNLAFHRPFARVCFQLVRSIECTMKSVTLTNIKNNGTCTCCASSPYCAWASSGSERDFVITLNGTTGLNYPSDIRDNDYFDSQKGYLVMPQALGSDVRVELSYTLSSDPGTTKTAKATLGGTGVEWQPGYSYTYKLNVEGGETDVQLGVTVTAWVNGDPVLTTVEE